MIHIYISLRHLINEVRGHKGITWGHCKCRQDPCHSWWHSNIWWLSTAHHVSFLLNQFSVQCRFPFPILFFIVKSPSVTQRSVSQDNAFKKSKYPSAFLRKTIGSSNSFTLIENNFSFLKRVKFEFTVIVHYGLWAKCIQLWALKRKFNNSNNIFLMIWISRWKSTKLIPKYNH